MALDSKRCSDCGEDHPATSEFFDTQMSRGKPYLTPRCRECRRTQRRRAREAHGAAIRKSASASHKRYRLKKFGLTVSEYETLLNAQNGLCAICLEPEATIDKRYGTPRLLAVDHDHTTGKVRGLLCFGCNTMLGKLGDNPAKLRKAAEYLEAVK